MGTQEELFKAISADEALVDELMKAWETGAGAQEIVVLLANKGIEAPLDQVEALLAQAQRAKAGKIEAEDIDIDELNRMAGGGDGVCDGTANCDVAFLSHPDIAKDKRCYYSLYCDENTTQVEGCGEQATWQKQCRRQGVV